MKRAKKLVTLLTIASLTLSSAVVAFGATETEEATTVVEEKVAEVDATAVVAEEKVVEEVAPTYVNLAVTQKSFYNDSDLEIGTYPVITGMDELNKSILNLINTNYSAVPTNLDNTFTGTSSLGTDLFTVTYKVEDLDQYAKITISMNSNVSTVIQTKEASYYVDKATMTEITAEAFELATADALAVTEATDEAVTTDEATVAEEVTTKEVVAEVIMVPLRTHAEALGFTLGWDDATKSVTVLLGEEVCTSVTVGKNEYTVAGVLTKLDAAPVNEDGNILVPVSFFEKVLGATVVIDDKGVATITLVVEEKVAEDATDKTAA